MNIVITGANRGIGLELARQYVSRGDRVYAGVRTPEAAAELAPLVHSDGGRLTVWTCDVSNGPSVQVLAASLNHPVDILINNAGIRNKHEDLATLDLEDVARTLQVNAIGALRVSHALLPLLRRSSGAKIANISSGLGSIEGNTTGGGYGYRMSKAALNMATRSLAHDLRTDGIIAVALSPGWVKTDMGGSDAPTLVADSAAGLIQVIDRLTLEASGSFLDYRGGGIDW